MIKCHLSLINLRETICNYRNRIFLSQLILSFLCSSYPITAESSLPTPIQTEENMEKNERRARQKLAGINQDHIFTYWSDLNADEKSSLIQQIEELDLPSFAWQQQVLKQHGQEMTSLLEPFENIAFADDPQEGNLGTQLIAQGKVGCLVVAGGQGTRLRFEGPKGMYPVSLIKDKTLFQLIAEKTVAAGRQAGKMLQLAIMTSPQNHEETSQFFIKNNYLGLFPQQISFFSQSSLPLLDLHGNLFLENKEKISSGPDGNGSCLKAFVESGIWEKWKKMGIEYVSFILVDNPLADPFDNNLIGHHVLHQNDITIKSVERIDPKEKVGLVLRKNGKIEVVEYSEIPENEQLAILPNGRLKHRCANISLFCLGMDFIQDAAAHTNEMPLHLAFKAVKVLDENGVEVTPLQPNAWKFERFIFDILPLTDQTTALLYERGDCFAPLKNFDGKDSPETVRMALQAKDKKILETMTGLPAPDKPFELSQEFHYPTKSFKDKWRGKVPPPSESYYDANTIPQL